MLRTITALAKNTATHTRILPSLITHRNLLFMPHLTIPAKQRFSTQRELPLTRLIEAVKENDTTAIAVIAKEQPNLIAEQTHNDNTALHEAAKNGDVEMIELLSKVFSKEFNVNHRCHCYLKRTPLHYAVEGGHMGAVEALLKLGADPNIQNERGETALDNALKKNHIDIATLLAMKGGKANMMKAEAERFAPQLSAHRFAAKFASSKPTDSDFSEFVTDLSLGKKAKP